MNWFWCTLRRLCWCWHRSSWLFYVWSRKAVKIKVRSWNQSRKYQKIEHILFILLEIQSTSAKTNKVCRYYFVYNKELFGFPFRTKQSSKWTLWNTTTFEGNIYCKITVDKKTRSTKLHDFLTVENCSDG